MPVCQYKFGQLESAYAQEQYLCSTNFSYNFSNQTRVVSIHLDKVAIQN